MKVVVVITYFDRQFQLNRTLESIARTKHEDFEVIIVDDCSINSPCIGNYLFPIDIYRTQGKKWIDGSPAYNLGIGIALKRNPDVIILQNAETYHHGDVISYASKVRNDNYISFGCYNLSKDWTFKQHDLSWIIAHFNSQAVNNEDNAWLNHKQIRQMGYHWCSAITAGNLKMLNGFDEGFCDGYCFEDDEFLARVRILGLKVEITDNPFVVHQWHDRSYVPANWKELFEKNKARCEQIQKSGNYVAVHKFTDDF